MKEWIRYSYSLGIQLEEQPELRMRRNRVEIYSDTVHSDAPVMLHVTEQ